MKILIIVKIPDDRTLIALALRKAFPDAEFIEVAERRDFDLLLRRRYFDLVVAELDNPWFSGREICLQTRVQDPYLPVIILVDTVTEEALLCVKSGLCDFVARKEIAYLPVLAAKSIENAKAHKEYSKTIYNLRISDERFNAFFNSGPVVSFMKDENGRYVYLNEQCREFLQKSSYDILGKTIFDLYPSDVAAQIHAHDREVLSTGKIIELYETVPDADGIQRYWWVFKFPVKVSTGQCYIGGIALDVTKRKQGEIRQAAQFALTRIFSEAVAFHDALPEILKTICEGFGWELGELWRVDRDASVLRLESMWYAPSLDASEFEKVSRATTFPPGIGLPGRVWASMRPAVWITDVVTDDNFPRAPVACRVGLHGAVAFPLIKGSELVGVMCFFSRRVRPHEDEMFDIMADIGIRIGSFITRKLAEESLNERMRLATLGAVVGYALAQKGSLRHILQTCADALVRNLDVAFARIWTLNREADILELQCSAGIYTHIDGPHSRIPVGMYKIGLIAEERKPHLTNKVIGDPRVHNQDWARQTGMVAFAGYPLMIEDRIVGVMAMFSTKQITETAFKALASVSDMIALGIERKQTEEKLERYGKLFSETNDLAYICDSQGNILFVNNVFEKLTGHKPEAFFGKSFALLFDEGDMKKAMDAYSMTMRGESPEYELNFKDTGKRCEYRNIPWKDGTGNIIGVMGVARDITDRRHAEEEKERLREQLFRSQKLESVGALAGGVAHDFNNMLMAITGYGSLLESESKDVTLKDYARKVLKSAEKAANLTRGLLAFSRKEPSVQEPVNLNDLVKEVKGLLSQVIPEDIKLTVSLTEKCCVAMANSGQIEQVLMNLATNARDAMPGGGELTIATGVVEMDDDFVKAHGFGEAGRYALITVSDTGAGMDEKTRERVFEPFFTTKEVGKGTGLGLSIAYGIVRQHNGYIEVDSAVGRGATVRIYVPLIELKPRKMPEEIPSFAKGGTETILVAEDEENVRSLVKLVLEGHGYTVIEATNGKDAVHKFMENKDKVHMVLLDVVMPEKNGMEAYKEILKICPDMKALFMSGYGRDIIDKKMILEEGRLISKPVLPAELLIKVREALDK